MIRKMFYGKTLWFLAVLGGMVAVFGGCQRSVGYGRYDDGRYVRPSIAVATFENQAPISVRWDVGGGFSQQLADRLLRTRRFTVVDRGQFTSLLKARERRGQDQGELYREVRYLVKGTVTDFTHVEAGTPVGKLFDRALFNRGSHAVVAATVYVVDLQSGQVIATDTVKAKISADGGEVPYRSMAFGSLTFYRTPLGRATSKTLDKALRLVEKGISEQPYQPKIASVMDETVVINGGRDRDIRVGGEYVVRPAPEVVIDPDSGHVLGHLAGDPLGRVRVVQVMAKYSVAAIVQGDDFRAAQTLFPAEGSSGRRRVAPSHY